MFNTLGNLTADARARLLFIDFDNGHTLQISGRARVVWDEGRADEFAGAERVVEFDVEEAVETRGWTLSASTSTRLPARSAS